MTADPKGWPDPARPGVPENPERDGYHWVKDDDDPPVVALWLGRPGFQLWPDLRGNAYYYTYLGPCLTPTDHATQLREAVERARREGFDAGVAAVRKSADAHAGKWSGMDQRESIRFACTEAEARTTPADGGETNEQQ